MPFRYTIFKNHPLPHPPPDRSLCSLTLPLYQNHGYTTGTDVAKRHKGQPHPLPVDRQVPKKNVQQQQNAILKDFSKNLPTVERARGTTPSPGRSAPLALPPVQKSWLHHWHCMT